MVHPVLVGDAQFSFWLARSLIDLENLEERAAAFYRVFDLLVTFHQLHNFSGIVGAVSALESSAVFRLELSYDMAYRVCKQSSTACLCTVLCTCMCRRVALHGGVQQLSAKHLGVIERCRELVQEQYKRAAGKLSHLKPPCVPFLGAPAPPPPPGRVC